MSGAGRAVGLSLVLLGFILLGVFYVSPPANGVSTTQCGTSAQNPCTVTSTQTQTFTSTVTSTRTITSGSNTTTTTTTTVLSTSTSVLTTTLTVIYNLNGAVSTTTQTVTQTQTSTGGVNGGIATVKVLVNWDGKPIQGATVSLYPAWSFPSATGSCAGSSLGWITCPSITPLTATGATGTDGTYSTIVKAASAGSFEGYYNTPSGGTACCTATGAQAGYFITVTANGVTTQQGSIAVVNNDGTLNSSPSATLEADPNYVPPCTAGPKFCSQLSTVMVGGLAINGTYLLYAGVGSLALGGVVLAVGSRKGGPSA